MVSAYLVYIYISYLTSDEESHTVPYCPNIHGITTSQVISQETCWQLVRNHSGAGCSFPLCTHGRPPNFSCPSLQHLHLGANLLVWCRTLQQPGPVGPGTSFWWKKEDLCVLEASSPPHLKDMIISNCYTLSTSASPEGWGFFVKYYQTGQTCFSKGCSVPGSQKTSVHRGFSFSSLTLREWRGKKQEDKGFFPAPGSISISLLFRPRGVTGTDSC